MNGQESIRTDADARARSRDIGALIGAGLGTVAFLLAGLVAPTIAPRAQNHLVLPPLVVGLEGNAAEAWAAGPYTARRQLVVKGSWLQFAQGRSFTSLTVRRNQGTKDDQGPGRLLIEVALSHSLVEPEDASGTFANNRGRDATNVFTGRVDFPAAPYAPTTPAPWQASMR